jgi:hypothetical protein
VLYTKVVDCLAEYAHVSCGQIDVRLFECVLEQATDIMSEVETICAVEGVEDGSILATITDAQTAANGVTKMVGLLRARPSLLEHRATVKEAAAAAAAAEAKTAEREVAQAAATAKDATVADAKQRQDTETALLLKEHCYEQRKGNNGNTSVELGPVSASNEAGARGAIQPADVRIATMDRHH